MDVFILSVVPPVTNPNRAQLSLSISNNMLTFQAVVIALFSFHACKCKVHQGQIFQDLSLKSLEVASLDCPLSLNWVSFHWLRDSVLLHPLPRNNVQSNGTLSISGQDLPGIYLCLVYTTNSVAVVTAYNITIKYETPPVYNSNPLLLKQYCPENSRVSLKRHRRIIDGNRAKIGTSPWMGMITNSRNIIICGCTLISEQFVITAAHCLYSIPLEEQKNVLVKLGKYLRNQKEPGQFVSKVSAITLHPDFHSRTEKDNKIVINANDIALLKLSERVPISLLIHPIYLPYPGYYQSLLRPTLAVVTGWGRVSVEKPINAYTLQETILPLVDKQVCMQSSDYALAEGTLCAGYAESYKPDTCDGDSGGPLIISQCNTSVLIGIVSWGQGCSSPGKYGIYTNVENYLDWILTIV